MCLEICKSGVYFCGVVLLSWSLGFFRVGWEMERYVGIDGGDFVWYTKLFVLYVFVVIGSY